MPVNLPAMGHIAPVPGVRLGSARAPVKANGERDDVALIELAAGSTAAGVFTQSRFRAPPVVLCIERLAATSPRYLLINSGNANCATGPEGRADAEACCATVAQLAGVDAASVLPFSTGVIGERLPVPRVQRAAGEAFAALRADGWEHAARAIMTTDTAPKAMSVAGRIGAHAVSAAGMAKGSGMICPHMATMLAYVATDAAVATPVLQALTTELAEASFNRITVDGDTSTNDSFVVLATGASGAPVIDSQDDGRYGQLRELLMGLCVELAQRVIRDGEGATKFVTVTVDEARDSAEALEVAYTVAHSPLVKTAMYASDANWGRFCMAIGRAQVPDLDETRVGLWLDDVCVARGGRMTAEYTDAAGSAVMARDEFTVRISLGRGTTSETIWTTDLSHEYVRINAEYRT